jgi:peptide chain release factor 2
MFQENNFMIEKLKKLILTKNLKQKKYEEIINKWNILQDMLTDFPIDAQEEINELNLQIKREIEEILLQRTNGFFMEFNCGTGGLDAEDWTEMLLKMYLKFFTNEKIKYEIIDLKTQEEGGIKGAVIKVNYIMEDFQGEEGIHRLVRISPFNAKGKRQTSFASLFLFPFIDESKLNIEIQEKDLRIDVYRSSGAGGQHVNKTESAVRITHNPTGIVVQCQNEKSQHQNKETALNLLKTKLLIRKREEMSPERIKKEVTWSNHFRSYVLDPYKLIKDTRLNIEINSNVMVDNILHHGLINTFIEKYKTERINKIFNED